MTVSFSLTADQEQLKQQARSFAREQLRPLMTAVGQSADPLQRALLLRPVMEQAVQAGFLKSLIPVPFGGLASSGVDAAIFIEELASDSPDFVISMAGPLIALAPVYEVGTPEQIARFVAPFLADHGGTRSGHGLQRARRQRELRCRGAGRGRADARGPGRR